MQQKLNKFYCEPALKAARYIQKSHLNFETSQDIVTNSYPHCSSISENENSFFDSFIEVVKHNIKL